MKNSTRVKRAATYLEEAEKHVRELEGSDWAKKGGLMRIRHAISLLKGCKFETIEVEL